jgi:hypothetical protein
MFTELELKSSITKKLESVCSKPLEALKLAVLNDDTNSLLELSNVVSNTYKSNHGKAAEEVIYERLCQLSNIVETDVKVDGGVMEFGTKSCVIDVTTSSRTDRLKDKLQYNSSKKKVLITLTPPSNPITEKFLKHGWMIISTTAAHIKNNKIVPIETALNEVGFFD